MFRIAIVEDEVSNAKLLEAHIGKYEVDGNNTFFVEVFSNGFDFLDACKKNNYNVVFMDIMMPHLSGIETARNFRKLDAFASIIFVTNMAQYAINGYEVNALDFLIKPVGYVNFKSAMDKAMRIHALNNSRKIILNGDKGTQLVALSDILYVESNKHYLYYHLKNELLTVRGTISQAEQELSAARFVRCHKSFIINMDYVKGVSGYFADIGADKIPLGRNTKDIVMKRMAAYFGGDIL